MKLAGDKKFALNIPEDVYQAMKLPEGKKEERLMEELALALYEEEILSFGKARELAGMSKWEFHDLLNKRGIKRHYNKENLEEDIEYGRG